jgi:hypothetical protein
MMIIILMIMMRCRGVSSALCSRGQTSWMSEASSGAWGGLLGALGRLTGRTGAAYWARGAAYVLSLLCDAPPEVEVLVVVVEGGCRSVLALLCRR